MDVMREDAMIDRVILMQNLCNAIYIIKNYSILNIVKTGLNNALQSKHPETMLV